MDYRLESIKWGDDEQYIVVDDQGRRIHVTYWASLNVSGTEIRDVKTGEEIEFETAEESEDLDAFLQEVQAFHSQLWGAVVDPAIKAIADLTVDKFKEGAPWGQ